MHVPHILSQAWRKLAIGKRAIVFFRNPHPGTEMDFVDGNGGLQGIPGLPVLHPLLIGPPVFEVPYHGGGARWFFMPQSEGVGLVDDVPVMMRNDMKFINRALGDAGDEALPDARAPTGAQRMRTRIPPVEAANDRHLAGVRRPHAEAC